MKNFAADYSRLTRVSRDELFDRQFSRFREILKHHYDNNKHYRRKLWEKGMTPEDIKEPEDIKHLPVITTKDLITDKFGEFHTTPEEKNITYLHTSGSTGKSKIIPVSEEEVGDIFYIVGLAFYLGGVKGFYRKEDGSEGGGIIYPIFPRGPWPSAFFAQGGAQLIGPTVMAGTAQPFEWHAEHINRMKPKYILSSPSYISSLFENTSDFVDYENLGLERILLAGEPMSERFRNKIEELFHSRVTDLYGCAEIAAASVEHDSIRKSGLMYYFPDFHLIESVNDNFEPLPEGERGRMLVTPLFKKSLPLIRYDMRDIITLHNSKRLGELNLPLVSRILGRVDDMMTYGGANIYPDMIYSAVEAAGLVPDKFRLIFRKSSDGITDEGILKVELQPISGRMSKNEAQRKLEEALLQMSSEYRDTVTVARTVPPIKVEVLEPNAMYEGTGKFRRFIDER